MDRTPQARPAIATWSIKREGKVLLPPSNIIGRNIRDAKRIEKMSRKTIKKRIGSRKHD